VTVREWIARQAVSAPTALRDRMLAIVGSDGARDSATAAETCIAAAERAFERLLQDRRFGRDSALELLAIDALTTYAFQHAAQDARHTDLDGLVESSLTRFGQLATARV